MRAANITMSDTATTKAAADRPAISKTIADFAHGLTHDAIPAPVRHRAKHLILDAVGIALAAGREAYAARFLAGLQGLGEAGASSVIGMAAKLPLRDAAIMNGALVHGLDFDDTHMKAVVHATAVSLPAALAVAEKTGASGRELLAAYLTGMETAIRLGMAANFGFHHRGLHATGIVGHFSSAVIAGKLMGLDADAIARAQGIAGSTAMASQQFVEDGAWNKRLHPGWAAAAGITAAHLAAGGFVAPERVYEGRFGLYVNLCGGLDGVELEAVTDGLGERWEAVESAVKPFPTCHFTHAAADAALALRGAHGIEAEAIQRIRALVPEETIPVIAEPRANKIKPASDYDAKFSTPFVVAAALIRGRFGLAELAAEALSDPDILALAAKVHCEADPEADFPRVYPGSLVITMADGTEYVHHERINRGAADRALTDADIIDKFAANAALAVSERRAGAIRDAVLNLDHMTAPELTAELAGG